MSYYTIFYIDLEHALAGRPHGEREPVAATDDQAAIEHAFTHAPFGHIPHLVSETNLHGPDRVVWSGAFVHRGEAYRGDG
jgi:hypothetical protein